MFAEIVLHRRMPKKFDSFTYAIPKNLDIKPGQIVAVPFRKKVLPGIVLKIHSRKPNYPTRNIESASSQSLTQKQMALASWMSEKYKCTFNKVFDLFLPEKIWLDKIDKNAACQKPRGKSDKKTDKTISVFAKNLLRTNAKKLVFEKTPLPRKILYKEILNFLPKNSQTLFLFPELFHLKKLTPDFLQYHGGLSEKQKASSWTHIKNEKKCPIAATRLGLFLPFKKLSCIVIDFEHNENYNEKRQPNYNSIEVAEKLAELFNIPLILISPTPTVETWEKTNRGLYKKYGWDNKATVPLCKVKTIDMSDERRKHNFSVFAEKTIESIAANLAQNFQTLLFINKKGEAGALFCRDCGNIFRCNLCNSALTPHAENLLHCHKCHVSAPTPIQCDKCESKRLKPLGCGTEKLEQEIKKIFSKAKIIRLDKEILRSRKTESETLDEKKLNQADIIIATKIIDKPISLPRLNLTVAITPDSMLDYGDFRAFERLFQLLTHLKFITVARGELLIQTYMPEHSLYKILMQNIPEKFYEHELETRKSLSLPPF